MTGRARAALFTSGVFFGGGLDHMLLIARDSPVSHYGLHLSPLGQLGFAVFDFTTAIVLYLLHRRWSPTPVMS